MNRVLKRRGGLQPGEAIDAAWAGRVHSMSLDGEHLEIGTERQFRGLLLPQGRPVGIGLSPRELIILALAGGVVWAPYADIWEMHAEDDLLVMTAGVDSPMITIRVWAGLHPREICLRVAERRAQARERAQRIANEGD